MSGTDQPVTMARMTGAELLRQMRDLVGTLAATADRLTGAVATMSDPTAAEAEVEAARAAAEEMSESDTPITCSVLAAPAAALAVCDGSLTPGRLTGTPAGQRQESATWQGRSVREPSLSSSPGTALVPAATARTWTRTGSSAHQVSVQR